MLKASNLQQIDFNELYKEQQKKSSFAPKLAQHWDKKAPSMSKRVFESVYVKDFISKLNLDGVKTLLDVGCGPGTLGVSLADKLEKVYCLDFSSEMLKFAKKNAQDRGLSNVVTMEKSFYDDWSDVPKCDMLIASRCMMVKDAKETLKLLNSKAKRVYISYKTDGSFIDEEILNLLDEDFEQKPSYMHFVNILYNMGICADVSFIRSENDRFVNLSLEQFIRKIEDDIGELSKGERDRLRNYHENVYTKKEQDGFISWALISYDTTLGKLK